MTKKELIESVAAANGAPKALIERVLDSCLITIQNHLDAPGQTVALRGFGTFRSVQRGPRVARNPRTGAPVEVEAKTVTTFKASRVS